MAKPKMTKKERDQREDALADTMFYALATQVEEHALAWGKRAKTLMEGLPQASIKRARRRAHKLAEGLPPGFVQAMEGRELFEAIMRRRKITSRDEDTIWGAIAQFCMYQLAARQGPFYKAALDFRLVPGGHAVPIPVMQNSEPSFKVEIIRLQPPTGPEGCGNPDCPNCRPRTAEELN
jgi:hypothetical protein